LIPNIEIWLIASIYIHYLIDYCIISCIKGSLQNHTSVVTSHTEYIKHISNGDVSIELTVGFLSNLTKKWGQLCIFYKVEIRERWRKIVDVEVKRNVWKSTFPKKRDITTGVEWKRIDHSSGWLSNLEDLRHHGLGDGSHQGISTYVSIRTLVLFEKRNDKKWNRLSMNQEETTAFRPEEILEETLILLCVAKNMGTTSKR